MLDQLDPWLSSSKAKDLLRRLRSENPDQSIPSEYELALTWGVSRVAALEIEKPAGAKFPDLFSADLFGSGPTFVEVTALSDAPLSDEVAMKRAANIISNYCNSIRGGSGRHLVFQFLEKSGNETVIRKGRSYSTFVRRRLITRSFDLDDTLRELLRRWLTQSATLPALTLRSKHIGVVITWQDRPHERVRAFSLMPSEAYDLRDNPLYRALKDKERSQLRNVPPGVRRGIFLGDAGCALLRNLRPGRSWYAVRGEDIIRTFMAESAIDVVCVFSPKRLNENSLDALSDPRVWHLHVFDRRSAVPSGEYDRVLKLQEQLPPPRLHGYQARSWVQNRLFDSAYLPTNLTSNHKGLTVRISARGLRDLLAGHITHDKIIERLVGNGEFFNEAVRSREVISDVRLERGADGSDDDYIVIQFSPDVSVGGLRMPAKTTPR